MNHQVHVLFGILLISLTSCVSEIGERNTKLVIENGIENIQEVSEFKLLFDDAIFSVQHFGGVGSPLTWGARAILHERYVVEMFFDVKISSNIPSRISDSKYSITEITIVTVLKTQHGGLLNQRMGDSLYFGSQEWKVLMESNCDFSRIGFDVKEDDPVENIDLVRHFR